MVSACCRVSIAACRDPRVCASSSSEKPVEPALTLCARGAAVHAEALGDGVDGVSERYACCAAGYVGGELVYAVLIGGVKFFVGMGVSDEKAAFFAAAGGVLDPRDARILLPLCHPSRIS